MGSSFLPGEAGSSRAGCKPSSAIRRRRSSIIASSALRDRRLCGPASGRRPPRRARSAGRQPLRHSGRRGGHSRSGWASRPSSRPSHPLWRWPIRRWPLPCSASPSPTFERRSWSMARRYCDDLNAISATTDRSPASKRKPNPAKSRPLAQDPLNFSKEKAWISLDLSCPQRAFSRGYRDRGAKRFFGARHPKRRRGPITLCALEFAGRHS